MMRLRDWPSGRIGRMWLIGCLVEALLIVALAATGDPMPPSPRETAAASFAEVPEMSPAELAAALRDNGVSITREAQPSGDTLVRIRKDSSYIVARRESGTTTIVDASPDVRRGLENVGDALSATFDGLGRLLRFLAAVLLPIPVLLVSVTLAWAVLRLMHRTRSAPA